ncbi:MAG: tRNA (adenosine(37)-N6)-threonylcarbamoyltransferase complex dimerization subunit type 1 TsaB [Pseudomonadota bacterium]
MNLLGLDTSTDACSVALGVDGRTEIRHVVEARVHTRLLMPMIQELLTEAGLRVSELDALALGNGPGSFIGVRIAASVVQGLAMAANLKVVPISSLEVVAAEAFETSDADQIAVTQDARMQEVYLARFARDGGGQPTQLGDTVLHAVAQPIEFVDAAGPVGLAGGGWHRYPSLTAGPDRQLKPLTALRYPRADYLLRCARRGIEAGNLLAPDDIVPAYVRRKVASVPAR